MAPHSGLPLEQHATSFLHQQWHLHLSHLKQQPCFAARLIRQLQEYLGDTVVLHHADHELQQLRIFCPQQYFRGVLNTWQAPELFQSLPHLTPLNLHYHLLATVPPGLRTRYKCRKVFTIPYRTVHLKAKKKKGRILPLPRWQSTPYHEPDTRHHPPTPISTTPRPTLHSPNYGNTSTPTSLTSP